MNHPIKSALLGVVLTGWNIAAIAGWSIDGNHWRSTSLISRLSVVQGYVEGYSSAQDQTTLFACAALKEVKDCIGRISDATALVLPNFDGLTYGQLQVGLDVFYEDYRNRKIELPGAMRYVVRAIRGYPSNELEKFVERLRAEASK